MKTVKQLKEERALKLEAQQTLVNEVRGREDNPNFTEEEGTRFDALTNEIAQLDIDVVRAQSAEDLEKRLAGNQAPTPNADPNQSFEGFDLMRYLRNEMDGVAHEGPELAMREFADAEASAAGVKISGIPLPMGALQRAITVGGNGSNWIETLNGGFVEALRDKLSMVGLGAQFIGNLTGDIQLPVIVGGTASFATETGNSPDSGADTEKVDMSPKRCTATTAVSVQFMKQTSPDAARIFSNDLMQAIASAINKAAVQGGGGNEPTGILNTTGIGSVAIGTNGGAPSWKNIVDLEAAVAVENAEEGALGYLTNPKARAKLKTTAIDAGSGRFIWGLDNTVNGYRATSSNHVPSDLTKGTGTDLSAIIYGNFNDVVIGQWGVMDLIVDPYALKKQGQIEITANVYVDSVVRRPKSFAAIKDAVTA